MVKLEVGQIWQVRNILQTNWHKSSLVEIIELKNDLARIKYIVCTYIGIEGQTNMVPDDINQRPNWRLWNQSYGLYGLYCNKCHYFYEQGHHNSYLGLPKFVCWSCEIK